MLLSDLQEFEWYNEPENVVFRDKSMHITAQPYTDFWQSHHRGYGIDNGHFFFNRKQGDFNFVAKWDFSQCPPYSQCGVMLRIDEKNWFKAAVMYDTPEKPMLATTVTQNGFSDLAAQDVLIRTGSIWFKIKRFKGDYFISFSFDGNSFRQMRLLHLQNDTSEVKVGAYICSPRDSEFEAILSQVVFEN